MQTSTRAQVHILSHLSKAILRTVLYFDVFQFPLTKAEIRTYSSEKEELAYELDQLVENGLLKQEGQFFGIGNLHLKVQKRRAGEMEAVRFMDSAVRISSLLSRIPFIRCVCISGSLSKGYMDKDSDIDFFIIVRENRLWIVRSIFSILIFGFKGFNIKKYFCPNYIMVDSNLLIRDQTVFTATEILSLVPMYNQKIYDDFILVNEWVSSFLPNGSKRNAVMQEERKHRLDFLWKSGLCAGLDQALFSLYQWHYGRKFRNLADWKLTRTDVNFQKNIYKMHNTGHRSRILDQFEEKLMSYSKEFEVDLRPDT